jgi:outer membrane receptor protein involved in Fe transport
LSLRGGATFQVTDPLGLYVSYGEAFLPPTAEQLFAFPGFGSNADLRPEDSRSYEAGLRADVAATHLDVSVFRIDTTDEIVFDPTPLPSDPFGRNVNGGETRREGAEVSMRGKLASRLDSWVNVTIVNAEFQNGADRGKEVPLVPKQRYAGGVDLRLPAGVSLGADLLYVGSQVLDNDDANSQEKLGSYAVANVVLRWAARESAGRKGKGLTAFVEGRNILDRRYATRGIYAFDFSTFENSVFVTPAPGRRWLAGVSWKL